MAVPVLSLVARLVVYTTVMAGCITALVGLHNSQSNVEPKQLFNGSQCLLFGRWYTVHATSERLFRGGNESWCTFCVFCAASQLCLASLMALVAIVKLHKYHTQYMYIGEM